VKKPAQKFSVFLAVCAMALTGFAGALPAAADETPVIETPVVETPTDETPAVEPNTSTPTEEPADVAEPSASTETVTFTGYFTEIAAEDESHADGTVLFRVLDEGILRVDTSALTVPLSYVRASTVTLAVPAGVEPTFAALSAYNLSAGAIVVSAVEVQQVNRTIPRTEAMINQTPSYKDSHKIFAVLVTPGNVAGASAAANQTVPKVVTAVNHASTYWSSQTAGLVSFSLEGTIPWYKSTYSCATDQGSTDLWIEAQNKAVAQLGFAAAQDAHIVLFFPSASNCGGAIGLGTIGTSVNTGGYVWVIGTDAPIEEASLSHELGHNMSLSHADWADCASANPNPGYSGTAGCTMNEYGDLVDVMAGGVTGRDGGALSSPQAIRAGLWSSSAYSVAPKGTTSYTLNAVSSNTGKRSVIVEDADGVNYFVEFRNFTGEDAQYSGITCASACTVASAPGVRIMRLEQSTHNVYDADTESVYSEDLKGFAGDHSYLIGRTVGGEHLTSYSAGQSFTSAVPGGIKVNVVSIGSSTAKVTITRSTNVNTSDWVYVIEDYAYSATHDDGYNFHVGDTYTIAIGSAWKADSYSYQWYRNGSAISGATKQSYTLASADVNKCFWVKVTGKASGRASKSIEYPQESCFGYVQPGVITQGAVRIDNTSSTLKAVPTGWTTPRLTYKYQWYRGASKITGATSSTYKPTTSDRGNLIKVSITASRSGFPSKSATSAAANYTLTASAAPVVSGIAQVGKTLSVTTPSYSTVGGAAPSATVSYQWYRSGSAISGATLSTYALVSADYGKKMTVKVTGSLDGYIAHAQTSASTATVIKGSIAGTLAAPIVSHGASLVLSAALAGGSVTEPGVKVSWQWYRGTSAITGATKSTKTLTSSDYGKTISVRATVSKSNYTTVKLSSTPVDYTVYVNPAKPVIIDELAIGHEIGVGEYVVTASGATISGANYTDTYQWYRNSSAISGATAAGYTLTASDVGKAISVKMNVAIPGFLSKSATSSATQKIGSSTRGLDGWNAQAQATVSKSGLVLSVASTGITELGTTQKYQWYRGSSAISGATSVSYTLKSSDIGKLVWVKVTTSKSTFTTIVKSSEPTNYTVQASGAVTFDSAAPYVGQTLSVVLPAFTTLGGAYVPDSSAVTYKWYRDGTAISGATGSSRVLTSSDYKKALSVKVTVKAPDFLTLSISSAKTSKVLPS
jgi:hypothetical protein